MFPFLKGFVAGLVIAAPIGPIGMLCIRRALADGPLVAFTCGLGVATADACYGSIAAFGLSAVSRALLEYEQWFQLGGGLFLVGLAIAIFRSPPTPPELRVSTPRNLTGAYTSTLVLTLMNPMTILSFIGIFAGLGLGRSAHGEAWLLVLGVFLGSIAWWIVVSITGNWLSSRLQHGGLRMVNLIGGLVILGFGGLELVEFALRVSHRL